MTDVEFFRLDPGRMNVVAVPTDSCWVKYTDHIAALPAEKEVKP